MVSVRLVRRWLGSSAQRKSFPVVIETPSRRVPVHLYADTSEVEPDALKQLVNLAESGIAEGFVAAMPDVHLGKGVAIGGVFASDKFVCPNAVGVDIGCGMCAVPFQNLFKDDLRPEQLQRIHSLIRMRIPTAFEEHDEALGGVSNLLEDIANENSPADFVRDAAFGRGKLRQKALKQIGSLGGGNHFIELSADETNQVWIVLHSGSRHLGNATASRYNDLAIRWMKKNGIKAFPGINYLEIDSDEGQAYLADMLFCQQYAFENRRHMRDICVATIGEVTGALAQEERSINVHHNFCACERCTYIDALTGELVEKNLWVTRKGATPAREGEYGVIPGSMATGCYVTKGKGAPKAWNSSSHGAGRKMSRTKAYEVIRQDQFEEAMKGVVWDQHPSLRDEAPQAYKNLEQVMANQESMVEIVHHLKPIVNVKGLSGKANFRKRNRR